MGAILIFGYYLFVFFFVVEEGEAPELFIF
jgi:hypothetical protein